AFAANLTRRNAAAGTLESRSTLVFGGDEQAPSRRLEARCRAVGGGPGAGALRLAAGERVFSLRSLAGADGVASPRTGRKAMTMRSPSGAGPGCRGAARWAIVSGALWAALVGVLGAALTVPALAGSGQPSPRQIGFQDAVTPIAAEIHRVHDYVNVIIIAITTFVLLLLIYVIWRFSEKRNPTPSPTTHNTTIEVLWTVVPVFILVAIAIPSFKLLFDQYTYPPPDLTIKAIGHTWNWTHEYPDQGLSVDSVMLQD